MATGTATIDFGATPTGEGSVTVTGQSALGAADHVEAFVMREATAGNSADEHQALGVYGRVVCDNDAGSDQFTIRVSVLEGYATGQFNLRWVYAA